MRSNVIASALILIVSPCPAADQHPITPADLWKVARVGPPSVAPDGKWCVVEVTRFDTEKDENRSDLWLLATDGQTQRQLTSATGKSSGPKWSPDGNSIAFTAKRDGDDQPQVYVIAPFGGEARRVSHLPSGPASLKWSGDSKTIYCIASSWPDTPDDESHRKREKEQKDAKSKAFVIDGA